MAARVQTSVKIGDVAFGGRGVGRLPDDGRAVFVPFVLTGEEVRVEIQNTRRHYAEGRLLSVLAPAPQRVEPPCPYFGQCGGCSYQHANYAAQLEIKRKQVADILRRVGKLGDNPPVEETIASPEIYGYRNRIRVHARDGALGFFSLGPGERRLLDIEQCSIASPGVNDALRELRERYRRGKVQDGQDYNVRSLAPDPAAGERRGRLYFQQTNDDAAALLLDLVGRLALSAPSATSPSTQAQHHLVDAYCGAGFFSHPLAANFSRVTGIEWDRRAVETARAEAGPNERYVAGDVAAHLATVLAEAPAEFTTLLVDPPAEGLAQEVADAIAERPPAVLIYISCQPPTLARDLARLRVGSPDGPLELVSVTPLDMFPQTAEIEAVAFLRARQG